MLNGTPFSSVVGPVTGFLPLVFVCLKPINPSMSVKIRNSGYQEGNPRQFQK